MYYLLIFTYYVYKAGENLSLDLKVLKRNIHKRKENEKQASKNHKKSSGWVQWWVGVGVMLLFFHVFVFFCILLFSILVVLLRLL